MKASGRVRGAAGEKVLEMPRHQSAQFESFPPPLPSGVTSGKTITLSGPQFPYLWHKKHSTPLQGGCEDYIRWAVGAKTPSPAPGEEQTKCLAAQCEQRWNATAGSSAQTSESREGGPGMVHTFPRKVSGRHTLADSLR